MTIISDLKSQGWHLSNEGLDLCSENADKLTVSSVIKKALDMDLREIGGNFLTEDLTKGKMDSLSGPGVVQIQKIKNASAPKYEYGSGAPPILRLLLTDGINYVNCLQWGHWKSVSMETPPGTKIYLKPGKISMQNNFLLLNENQFTVLGGTVAAMVEKWELCRQLASHIRAKENLDGSGPPPWIPFGQPIIGVKPSKSSNFKSLESEVKDAKEDAVFKQQRQANIAEVSRVKEAKAKSFGGRKEKPISVKPDSVNTPYGQSNYGQSSEYMGNDNEPKRYGDSTQDSPMRSKSFTNDRGRKNVRNDYTQARQDNPRFQTSGNVGGSQPLLKDNKLENRNKLGDFITHDIRQHSALQSRPPDSEMPYGSTQKLYKTFSKDYKSSGDKRPQKYETKNLVNMLDQVNFFGYDVKDVRNNVVTGDSSLKSGMEVMAKYWEDNQYYRAVIHAVGKEGKTCVVRFLDYGNYEEVLMDDVQEKNSLKERNWNVGPISFQPTPRANYENYNVPHNQNYRDVTRPHQQNSGRAYGRQEGSRVSRTEYRPSAKIYQPPSRRDTNS